MTKYVAFVLLGLSVAGCATTPDPRQFSQGYYGYRYKNYMDYQDPTRNHALLNGAGAGGASNAGP